MSEISLRVQVIGPHERGSRAARARLGDTGLVLERADRGGEIVPYGRIEIERDGKGRLRLGWREADERVEIVVEGRETLDALRARAPAQLAERLAALEPERPRVRGPARVVMMVAGVTLLLAAAGLLAVLFLPARVLVALTPWALEARAGELLATTILADSGGAERGDAARALGDLGDRLAELAGASHPIAVHLLASPDADLIVAPGGHVIVPTGAITAAAGASALTHELARAVVHADRGHALAQAYDQIGRLTMLSILLGALPEFGEALPRTARRLGGLSWSSAQEEEAERAASTLVAELDASALDRGWEALRADALAAENRGESEENAPAERR
jgi:hypothetical protein